MLHINPLVYDHLEEYKMAYARDKIVTIRDLLVEQDANRLSEYLLSVPDSQWLYAIHPYMENNYTFDNNQENKDHIEKGIMSANNAYHRGLFSYCFRRFEGYEQDGITIKEFLLSSQFLNLLHQITNLSLTSIVSNFGSCYAKDNYLSTHSDGNRGKIAYVFNLTKHWKEEWGGNFELLQDDYSGLKQRVTPNCNAFTLFDVSGSGKPHRVERVKSDVQGKRIAFSGWLA